MDRFILLVLLASPLIACFCHCRRASRRLVSVLSSVVSSCVSLLLVVLRGPCVFVSSFAPSSPCSSRSPAVVIPCSGVSFVVSLLACRGRGGRCDWVLDWVRGLCDDGDGAGRSSFSSCLLVLVCLRPQGYDRRGRHASARLLACWVFFSIWGWMRG